MLTFEEARKKAQEKLLEIQQQEPSNELMILDDQLVTRARGWAFFYNTKKYTVTHHPPDGLLGNGPIFVDRDSANVYVLPSGGYMSWLDEYDRSGNVPPASSEMRWVGQGPRLSFPPPRSRGDKS